MNPALALLACLAAGVPGQTDQPRLWAAPATTRIMPKTPPSDWTVELSAARNEWEAFQVVVTAGDEALEDVQVVRIPPPRAVTVPPPPGVRLPDATLYREQFIQVGKPSPRSDAQPGWYPDALIPLDPEWTGYPEVPGARYQGQGFAVPAGQNQPVWVDVHVPHGVAPGVKESWAIFAKGKLPGGRRWTGQVPFRLTVRPFTLPDRPACRSSFGNIGIARLDAIKDAKERDALRERYIEALIAHRLMPTSFPGAMPSARPDGSIDITESHPVLKHYIEDLHINCFCVEAFPYAYPLTQNRELTKTYLRNLYAYLSDNGWQDMHYIYVLDEPNDAAAYEEVRQRAKLIHEANPNLKVMCTEQTLTSDPAWGDLLGAVDIWCPLWPLHDPATGMERLAAGNELWSYTALCQGGNPTPFWELDFPPLNYRIPLWQNWRSHMTGLLYWSTVDWGEGQDPWRNPDTYNGYNGEGSLFYPGEEAGIAGPVASIRLKMLREGMEDYDYLKMLEDLRGRDYVDRFVSQVCRDWFDWEKDPAVLYKVRDQIADEIVKAT